MIGLLKWSDDSENLWGVLAKGWIEDIFYQYKAWEVKKYSTGNLPLGLEFELNANRGLCSLVIIRYYWCFSESEYNSSKKSKLYIYDLDTQKQQTISTSITKRFNPKWLDDNTIEFDSPNGNGRQIYKID